MFDRRLMGQSKEAQAKQDLIVYVKKGISMGKAWIRDVTGFDLG